MNWLEDPLSSALSFIVGVHSGEEGSNVQMESSNDFYTHSLRIQKEGGSAPCVLTPPPGPPTPLLPVISLPLKNTVLPVRACLSIWLERFRGSQKEDERGPLSIQSSLPPPPPLPFPVPQNKKRRGKIGRNSSLRLHVMCTISHVCLIAVNEANQMKCFIIPHCFPFL
jgi:hypothetical protein